MQLEPGWGGGAGEDSFLFLEFILECKLHVNQTAVLILTPPPKSSWVILHIPAHPNLPHPLPFLAHTQGPCGWSSPGTAMAVVRRVAEPLVFGGQSRFPPAARTTHSQGGLFLPPVPLHLPERPGRPSKPLAIAEPSCRCTSFRGSDIADRTWSEPLLPGSGAEWDQHTHVVKWRTPSLRNCFFLSCNTN